MAHGFRVYNYVSLGFRVYGSPLKEGSYTCTGSSGFVWFFSFRDPGSTLLLLGGGLGGKGVV